MANYSAWDKKGVQLKPGGRSVFGAVQLAWLRLRKAGVGRVVIIEDAPTRIIRLAKAEIGIRENPPNSNTGLRVVQYQHSTSLGGTRWPWCAAFCQFILQLAGHGLGNRSASVPELESWARAHGLWTQNPRPGYLSVFEFQGPVADHIGIVTATAPGFIGTIEGNTSNDRNGSQSNGGCVAAKIRSKRFVRGYIKTW